MNYIRLTQENLEKEHICCALSDSDPQTVGKKAWLAERLKEGLVFLKAEGRGKCFIEYIPAEYAWLPIDADGCMHINCFWVSGSLKGHGYAGELLDACIRDAMEKGKKGLTAIASPKKLAFLSDPRFLSYKGFKTVDTASPYFTLMFLPFEKTEKDLLPKFRPQVLRPQTSESGFALYYTCGCPFTEKYALLVENLAQKKGVPFKRIKIDTLEKAKNAPAAWTNYALFYDGNFITHEILSEKKFLSIVEKRKA